MRPLLCMTILGVIASAAAAGAQGYDRGRGEPVATLYELPGFQGRQTVIYGRAENLPRQFNDMAMSGRFEGRWRVCEHSDFGGRCVNVEGDVADLQPLGLAQRVSSLKAEADSDYRDRADDPRTGGYGGDQRRYDPPYDNRNGRTGPADGARNVFYPYPSYRGEDIEATPGAADRFCRSNGLGSAAYFETGAPQDYRYARQGVVLRDVLCRRRGGVR